MSVWLGEGRMQRAAVKAVGNGPEPASFSFQEQLLPERSQEAESLPAQITLLSISETTIPAVPWRTQACFKTHNSSVNAVKEESALNLQPL